MKFTEDRARWEPRRFRKYPFLDCPVNHTFFIPEGTMKKISPLVCYYNKSYAPMRFQVRDHDKDGNREQKDGVFGVRVKRVQ